MIRSYFSIALRYLLKNKIYSMINIAGLSISLACAMLMVLYTKDEFTFDRFHRDVSSIFVITIDVRFPDGSSMDLMNETGVLQGPRFQASVPEIESFTRSTTLYRDFKFDGNVQSQPIMTADANFFTMFTFPLLRGNPATALQQPNSVVISEDAAIKYFGTLDALDKTILAEKDGEFKPYVVTGVAKRCPENSSLRFDILFPLVFNHGEDQSPESWASLAVNTFVKLRAGSDIAAISAKMQTVFERESKEVMDKVHKDGFEQSFYHGLQPLTDVHLEPDEEARQGITNGSNPVYSYVLSGIAIFILSIACINFINLTIARSVRRAKEIGIRKVIGGARKQLIAQFLGESFLISFVSFAGAVLLSQLLLPWFNDVVNKQLSLSYLLDVQLIVIYLVLFFTTALLAGFYPAIVLSGYSPVHTLYNQFRISGSSVLQKGLVVFQFTLATFMIIATFGVALQFDYLSTKDLGYRSEQLVQVPKRNLTAREAKLFGEELMKNAGIAEVTPHGYWRENAKIHGDSIYNFRSETIGENFVNVLDLKVIDGRNFSSEFPSDSAHALLINEAFARMAGWTNPIGKELHYMPFDGEKKTVIGVIKDYHFHPLSKAIEAQVFNFAPNTGEKHYREMLVRIHPGSETASLRHIETVFRKLFPMSPYSYQFSDEVNAANYDKEAKWRKIILAGASLTIFVACMGLLGLSMLATERRFKEIGIRKVLGASVKTIVLTLSGDFVFLIILALLLAIPFAYVAITRWLETYPYRTDISPLMFVTAGALVLVVALCTTGYNSIKTALMNPAEALRRE